MRPKWFARPDWPLEHELAFRARLMGALRCLPGGDALGDDEAEGLALMLLAASSTGSDDELPRNRDASQKASEAELCTLHKLAGKLAEHIDAMHRPAVAVLTAEGVEPFTLAARLRELQDETRAALSELQASGSGRGAPQKAEAAAVTEAAAAVFERITGQRATHTNYASSGVGGLWPEFLRDVFEALGVKASVASQVRAR